MTAGPGGRSSAASTEPLPSAGWRGTIHGAPGELRARSVRTRTDGPLSGAVRATKQPLAGAVLTTAARPSAGQGRRNRRSRPSVASHPRVPDALRAQGGRGASAREARPEPFDVRPRRGRAAVSEAVPPKAVPRSANRPGQGRFAALAAPKEGGRCVSARTSPGASRARNESSPTTLRWAAPPLTSQTIVPGGRPPGTMVLPGRGETTPRPEAGVSPAYSSSSTYANRGSSGGPVRGPSSSPGRQATTSSILAARARSRSVTPPASWLQRRTSTQP